MPAACSVMFRWQSCQSSSSTLPTSSMPSSVRCRFTPGFHRASVKPLSVNTRPFMNASGGRFAPARSRLSSRRDALLDRDWTLPADPGRRYGGPQQVAGRTGERLRRRRDRPRLRKCHEPRPSWAGLMAYAMVLFSPKTIGRIRRPWAGRGKRSCWCRSRPLAPCMRRCRRTDPGWSSRR